MPRERYMTQAGKKACLQQSGCKSVQSCAALSSRSLARRLRRGGGETAREAAAAEEAAPARQAAAVEEAAQGKGREGAGGRGLWRQTGGEEAASSI